MFNRVGVGVAPTLGESGWLKGCSFCATLHRSTSLNMPIVRLATTDHVRRMREWWFAVFLTKFNALLTTRHSRCYAPCPPTLAHFVSQDTPRTSLCNGGVTDAGGGIASAAIADERGATCLDSRLQWDSALTSAVDIVDIV